MPDRDSDSESKSEPESMNQQRQQPPQRPKRNRRIIMRIELNDSDETGSDQDLDQRPSCSTATRLRRSVRHQEVPSNSESDAGTRKSSRKLRHRYGPQSDCSSSGSEVI